MEGLKEGDKCLTGKTAWERNFKKIFFAGCFSILYGIDVGGFQKDSMGSG